MRGVILDIDSLGPDDLDLSPLLDTLPDWQEYANTLPEETAERIAQADVVVTNKVVLTDALMQQAPHLTLICVAATGTNNVDLEAAKRHGITVTNVAGYSTHSVSQHTVGLILSLANQLPCYFQAVHQGKWSQSPFFCLLDYPIVELAGKTLGIVGYGAIGQQVAKISDALGMQVLISARPGSTEIPTGRTAFEEVLRQADVVSLHCPLTESTNKIIDAKALSQMKPDAFLINTARGGLIDEEALAEALRQGALGGAALDSLSAEPPPPDHPLLTGDIPNLLITPHCAWGSQQARQKLVDEVGENIRAFLSNTPRNRV